MRISHLESSLAVRVEWGYIIVLAVIILFVVSVISQVYICRKKSLLGLVLPCLWLAIATVGAMVFSPLLVDSIIIYLDIKVTELIKFLMCIFCWFAFSIPAILLFVIYITNYIHNKKNLQKKLDIQLLD